MSLSRIVILRPWRLCTACAAAAAGGGLFFERIDVAFVERLA